MSFAFPTDSTVLYVLQNYTMRAQFLADFVAFRKVPPLARRLALRDQCLNLGLGGPAAGWAVAQFFQLFCVVVGDYTEHLIEYCQELPRCDGVFLAKRACIHRNVGFAEEIEGG